MKKKHSSIVSSWFLKSFSFVLVVLAVLDGILYAVIRSYFYSSAEQTLTNELNLISTILTRYYNTSQSTYTAEVRRTVENFSKKDQMELMMINSAGRVTITSSGFEIGADYDMPDYKKALESESRMASYVGAHENDERVMGYTKILDVGDNNYRAVRVVSSLSRLERELGVVVVVIIILSAVVILLLMIIGIVFLRSIANPIREITKKARKIAKGDFSVYMDSKTDDEVGELCRVFNLMTQELKKTEDIKNDFISSVSHELRTPLTAIKGWSETIAQNPEDSITAAKGLKVISDETGRLSDMVEELLDFSRIQSGRFTLSKENTDIFAELTDAVIIYSEKVKLENKRIEYTEPEELVIVYADKNRLRQVFINIIDNAIKYSGANGVITIETSFNKELVSISITDNGCGIKAEDLPKVKSKFYKANMTVRGSGIGLAVADEIVSAHGGTLEVSSEYGKYTRVEITLPVMENRKENYEQ